MHYSRVMPPSGDHRYFTSTAVFLNEIIKLAVSLCFCLYESSRLLAPSTPATVLFQQISNSVLSSDGWKLMIPAALYTVQNLLQYVAISNLDAVHFQVVYQFKVGSPLRPHLIASPNTDLRFIVLTPCTRNTDNHYCFLFCSSAAPFDQPYEMVLPGPTLCRCCARQPGPEWRAWHR